MIAGDRDLLDPEIVGFKFARQAELRAHGFPVPRFCCVPGVIFDTVIAEIIAEHSDPPDDLTAGPEILTWAERMRARIASRGVPPSLSAEMLRCFDHIAGDSGFAAVRASAVASGDGQGEDGAADPFAGLSDSFLCVTRSELLSRVAACWASGYSDRVVRYRMRRGIDPLSVSVAVGIQEMVAAERSFVAFTRDPLDAGNRCVIAAAYGLGEGVVQEKADVDHFYVDLPRQRVTSRLVRKSKLIGLDPAATAIGPDVLAVAAELADTPVLTDQEAMKIAGLAAKIEAHFGAPQDIEGAITAEGQVAVVQARPIVSLAPSPTPTGKRVLWGNSNLTEGFPGVSCALTYSVAAQYGEQSFADFYRRLGVPTRVLAARRPDLRRLLGYVRGRMYNRLDTWYSLHSQLLPNFAVLRASWERAIGLPPRAQASADAASGNGDKLAGRLRRAIHYVAVAVRLPLHRRRVRLFLNWWDDYYPRLTRAEWTTRPAGSLVEEYHRLWVNVGERWGISSVNNYYLLLTGRLTAALERRWLPGAESGTLAGMLCGGAENRSVAAIRSALSLAELADRSPSLRSALLQQNEQQDDRQVWAGLAAGQYSEDIAAAARLHVDRYGDRGPRDLKMESVTIRAEPWQLLRIVRAYLNESRTAAGNRAQELQTRARAERELRARCRNPARGLILRVCYAIMREFLCFREDMRFCRSQLFGVSRSLLFELGAKLVKAGLLKQERDVLDLTVAEVLGAFQGTLPGTGLSGLAQVRRAEREAWEGEPDPPPLFSTDEDSPVAAGLSVTEIPDAIASRPAARRLTGIASSPGRVCGRARIILDPAIDVSECNDRILIGRETDPGWLFLMMAAKGIVVERGSPVSHAAISGRMLAIPTVVAVAGATSLIHDGDWVELDGTAGTVTLRARLADGAAMDEGSAA